jgi:UDP-3-O-[3-hydroxymyristoyl] N-acetylglucosamine deacetylase/3-hydroxyacyl-[acyl-carrier-protein] dehydratase
MVTSNARRPQRTIGRDADVRGIGFLTEADVALRFRPAPPGAGVVFRRVDLPGAPEVPAHVRHVVHRERRTTIQRGEAVVEMVEHVMAALGGLRIDNCVVEIDAAESPGCDGSSRAFVEALAGAGVVEQGQPRAALTIDRPITVRAGHATLTAHPGPGEGLVLGYNLDYGAHAAIGRQSRFVEVTPEAFREELAPSRTFLLEQEAQALKRAGLGNRLSESDLLIFGADGPINNALRFPDECVRHKLLDMVGDLALAGVDLVGHVVAHRSGHALNAELVRALLDQVGAGRDGPAACGPAPPFEVGAILRMLPHRYPFLLIDRVLEAEPEARVVAIKNVSINEPFFQGHWPGRPIMPGVLILEAMAQAAGILIAQKFGTTRYDAVIAGIDGAKLRRPVVPGDQLRLEVTTRRLAVRLSEVHARAFVGDEPAAEAKIRFVLVESQRAA